MTSSKRERFYEKLIADGRVRKYVPERDGQLKDVYVIVFTPLHERAIDTPDIKQRGRWSCERVPYGAMRQRIGLTIGIYSEDTLDRALRDLEALGKQYDVLVYRDEKTPTLAVS